MLTSQNMPVSTQSHQKLTPTLELELFAIRFFHSLSPMDARLLAQEKKLDALDAEIKELQRLVVFFLLEHKPQIDRLAVLCKSEKYFVALREGLFDFIDISMCLSAEAEIEFVGDPQSQSGKTAFQILAGIDLMLSIYNIQSLLSQYSANKILSKDEVEGLTRETLLVSRNLGLLIFVTKLTHRDVIDTEIAQNVHYERAVHIRRISTIREYDAQRYSQSYEEVCNELNSLHSEYFFAKEMPLVTGRHRGGSFNIKDSLMSFLEQLMKETGANDLPSVCAAIKRSCKETEPMTPGEMLFYWDDEPDTRSIRAAWMNAKKERKSEKVAIKTLANYINAILNKNEK
jgi:hypothetical protein